MSVGQIQAHLGGSATAGVQLAVERKNPNRACVIRGACLERSGTDALTINLELTIAGLGPFTVQIAPGIATTRWIDMSLNIPLPARATAILKTTGLGAGNKIQGALIVEEMSGG
jgi:hypothetical protein